jgi:hypothetical protein
MFSRKIPYSFLIEHQFFCCFRHERRSFAKNYSQEIGDGLADGGKILKTENEGTRYRSQGTAEQSNTKTNSNTLLTTEDTEGHGGKARPRLQITGDRLQQT